MKTAYIRRIALVSVATVAILTAGCASVAISDDGIEKSTAAALGLEKGSFDITDRDNDGSKTTYLVKANDGRKFSCYMTGTVSLFGRVSSDPVCTEIMPPKPAASAKAAPAAAATATTTAPAKKAAPCNALLKAAGKCK